MLETLKANNFCSFVTIKICKNYLFWVDLHSLKADLQYYDRLDITLTLE